VPQISDRGFVQSITLRWGYLYWSYLSFVLDRVEELRPASLLDVGSGEGRLVAEVCARLPAIRALGVDMSERAVALARAMTTSGEFRAGDITEHGFLTDRFDAITMVEVLEHIPETELPRIRSTLRKHLENHGQLVVTVPTKNMGMHPKHYQHFDLASLVEALQPDFALRSAFHLNRLSGICRLLDRALTNRWFAIREPRLLAWLYDIYKRRYLIATPATAMRICAVFEPASAD
jgi:SAM-dependent methyltransferase